MRTEEVKIKLLLTGIEAAAAFVSLNESYEDVSFEVRQGRYVVDGKSLLGVLSFNLVEPVTVVFQADKVTAKAYRGSVHSLGLDEI